MSSAAAILARLDEVRFFDQHWQRQPLVVRAAPIDLPRITRQELVALAGDSAISSRLIGAREARASWTVESGPLSPDMLRVLDEPNWTLLVQEIDRHRPDFARLLDDFRFVPNWRIDDVMVSDASDGGGVGPHLDRYDVFLLQLSGRRRWRVQRQTTADPELRRDTSLRILASFEPDEEWFLESGDMLYLPPGVAHEGTAIGDCMTASIGLRTPDPRELYAGFLRQLGPKSFEAIRYTDPELRPPERLGEIPESARRRLREAARRLFAGSGEFERWLGRYATQPLRPMSPPDVPPFPSLAELDRRLDDGAFLARRSPAHFAWFCEGDGTVVLFGGGEVYELGRGREELAELVCGRTTLDRAAIGSRLEESPLGGALIDLTLRGFLRLRDRE